MLKRTEMQELKGSSEFLMASTRKMQAALGRTPEEEHRLNIHRLTPHLRGHSGLLFTKLPPAEVETAMHSFTHDEFARAGAKAKLTVWCLLLQLLHDY
jgi:mRNA turnover protein 4